MVSPELPRVLIIDDVFGRRLAGHAVQERAALCGHLLVSDVTPDDFPATVNVRKPIAEAVFHRGQLPLVAQVGDVVRNDLEGATKVACEGWVAPDGSRRPWALILLDLCFYTGLVTLQSNAETEGAAEGRRDDDDPESYFGLALLAEIIRSRPEQPVVILSSKPREASIESISLGGALGFISRDASDAASQLGECLDRYGLIPDPEKRIVGHSPGLLLALRDARRAARHRRNVLIRGERGTGKELLAQLVHDAGGKDRPFVTVDSGVLSPTLFASELFGHKRGAFTGADTDQVGRMVRASGGDLFLDEIGNMSADVQAGLLRATGFREVTPVGSAMAQTIDVRLLSATNAEIEVESADGRFRPDLLDRLREGGTIYLPPLRDRVSDIPLIVEHVLRAAEDAIEGSRRRTVDADAMKLLTAYRWPGNVRELRNLIFDAVASVPDLDYLVSGHLRLGDGRFLIAALEDGQENRVRSGLTTTLPELATELELWRAPAIPFGELRAGIRKLWSAQRTFRARLLAEALRQTRRESGVAAAAELRLAPAVRFLTGESVVASTAAADLVKREISEDSALDDPILGEALRRAKQLRRRRPAEAPPSADEPDDS